MLKIQTKLDWVTPELEILSVEMTLSNQLTTGTESFISTPPFVTNECAPTNPACS